MNRLFLRHLSILAALAILLGMSGCSGDEPEPTTETSTTARPAAIQTIASSNPGGTVFNGVVRAAERAELAFQVAGRLIEMQVQEGDRVGKGEVLAKLDQEEFLRAVSSARVEFDKAQADYERGVKIFESTQAIAKSDLEKLKANRDLAKNRLSNARQDLANTELRAPFEGVIATKSVSNFRNVNSGQAIYVLHDLNDLEVAIDVPSRMFLSPTDQRKAFATVENDSGERLRVVYKSHSSESDSLSQTYRVVLRFTELKGQNVLPGMNARIYPDENGIADNTAIQVPVQAVVPTNTGGEYVWLLNDEGEVTKNPVTIGGLLEDTVVVEQGLKPGDRIVVAGVNALTEGMKVRPLKEKGQ
ncbi:efflux RND transporter periplasmic adaptor subunit [Marinobacter salexigens]|uniref:efflux RND transporter periplasmic adaptor subunit n=1 Tax=Marinobacter salexigens TaxID=1925763 RepID=UPI00137481E0|nr:efflux RND transporter periplasmic adaptor subunit [Marinobacter salexigens]